MSEDRATYLVPGKPANLSGPPFTMSKYANEVDLLRAKCAWLDARFTARLQRAVPIEQALLDAANGKRPLPTAEDCRAMAAILGVPSEERELNTPDVQRHPNVVTPPPVAHVTTNNVAVFLYVRGVLVREWFGCGQWNVDAANALRVEVARAFDSFPVQGGER